MLPLKSKKLSILSFFTFLCIALLVSYVNVLAEDINKRDMAQTLWEEGREAFNRDDYQAAKEKFNSSLALYREIGDQQSEADLLTWVAMVKIELGDFNSAIEYLQKSQNIYISHLITTGDKAAFENIETLDKTLEALTLHVDGLKYLKAQDYESAITKLNESLQIIKSLGTKKYEALLSYQIGTVFYAIGELEKAQKYYSKAMSTYSEIKNYEKVALAVQGEIYLLEGLRIERQNKNQLEAEKYFLNALKIGEDLDDHKLKVNSNMKLLKYYLKLQDYKNFLKHGGNLLELYREVKDKKGELLTLKAIGNIYATEMDNYSKSLEYYQQAIELAKEIDNSKETSVIQAKIYLLKGEQVLTKEDKNLMDAKDFFHKALEIGEALDDQNIKKRANEKLSSFYIKIGDFNKFLEHNERLLKLYRISKDRTGEYFALNNIAWAYSIMMDSKKALEFYQQALNIAKETKDAEREITVMFGISNIFLKTGDYQQAMDYLWKAIAIAKEIRNKKEEAEGYSLLGDVYRHLGDNEKAIEYNLLALNILEEIEENDIIRTKKGLIYRKIASLYRKPTFKSMLSLKKFNDRLRMSLEFLHKALSEYQKLGEHVEEGTIYVEMAMIYAALDKRSKAIDYIQRAKKIFNNIKAERDEMQAYETIGHTYTLLGDYSKSLDYLNKGLTIATRLNDVVWEYKILAQIGATYQSSGFFQEASVYYKKAFEIIKDEGVYYHKLLILSDLGYNARLSENLEDAKIYYSNAIEMIESIRGELKVEESRVSLESDFNKLLIYAGMIHVLLKLGHDEEAFDYAERAKSRALLDLLGNRVKLKKGKDKELSEEEKRLWKKINILLERIEKELSQSRDKQRTILAKLNKELEDARKKYAQLLARIKLENPELASLVSVAPLTLEEVQKLLDSDTTLLEYFVTPEKTFLWIVDKSNLRVIDLEIKSGELALLIGAYREKITYLHSDYKKDAKVLYDLLIKPAKPYIKTKKVGIVPHSVLHYLPFQALLNNEKFLIEEYAIFYTPSASVLKFVYEKRKKVTGKVLAFGNPDLGDEKFNLPYAEEEVKKIKEIYPEATLYLRDKATKEKVKKLSGDYNIIHFASHGELNPEAPLFSSIRLAKDKDEDGRLEVHEIFNLNLKNTSLVTLSACETGLGELTQGDELIGLTRGFIYAGTPSIVASLWRVNDHSTSELMELFYKNLKKHSKAEALRMAQLEMIRGKTGKGIVRGVGGITTSKESKPKQESTMTVDGSHPYFWAPFILLGDWQ